MTRREGRSRRQLLDELKETRDTENLKRKHWIALCGEVAVKEAVGRQVRGE